MDSYGLNVDRALEVIERYAQKHGYDKDLVKCSDTAKHIGFKRAVYNRIVILEITGRNNESRIYGSEQKLHAKMRCEHAMVKSIIDLNTLEEIDSATSIHDSNFEYYKNQVAKPVYPYTSDNSVCSSGIHYFLSPEAALMYGIDEMNISKGTFKRWSDFGVLLYTGTYKNWCGIHSSNHNLDYFFGALFLGTSLSILLGHMSQT